MHFPLQQLMSKGAAPLSAVLAFIYQLVGLHACHFRAKVELIVYIWGIWTLGVCGHIFEYYFKN